MNFVICTSQVGCNHYKNVIIQNTWDNKLCICNNKNCKNTNKKKEIQAYIHIDGDKNVYCTPVCDLCYNIRTSMALKYNNIDDQKYIRKMTTCRCCLCV